MNLDEQTKLSIELKKKFDSVIQEFSKKISDKNGMITEQGFIALNVAISALISYTVFLLYKKDLKNKQPLLVHIDGLCEMAKQMLLKNDEIISMGGIQ